MEPRQSVDDARLGVGPDAARAAIRGDGEDVRGAPQAGDGRPAGVGAYCYVLEKF